MSHQEHNPDKIENKVSEFFSGLNEYVLSALNILVSLLYFNNVLALAVHFLLNAGIAYFFATWFASLLHIPLMESIPGRLILVVLQIGTIYRSYETCITVPTYHGYLLRVFGINTHLTLRSGTWPMFLHPLFSIEAHEVVDQQYKAGTVPPTVISDKSNYTFIVEGLIPYHVTEEDSSVFTKSDEKDILKMINLRAVNAAISIFNRNEYITTTPEESEIHNMAEFNEFVYYEIGTEALKERGVTVDTPILTYVLTEATKNDFSQKTKALNTVLANKSVVLGQANALVVYKQLLQDAGMKISDSEAELAVQKAINGVNIYDFGGKGGDGGAIKLLNITAEGSSKK